LTEGAHAIGKRVAELELDKCGVTISAVRRKSFEKVNTGSDSVLAEGDVVVLLGTPQALAAGEAIMMRGL
jgi:monovalent cation:H+ antiporter-2, CPA2 family